MSPSSAPVAPELLDIGLPDARVERHLRSELARALEARADELDARV